MKLNNRKKIAVLRAIRQVLILVPGDPMWAFRLRLQISYRITELHAEDVERWNSGKYMSA